MADKKRNNALWCCDRIEEKIADYKLSLKELDKMDMSDKTREEVKRQLEIVSTF